MKCLRRTASGHLCGATLDPVLSRAGDVVAHVCPACGLRVPWTRRVEEWQREAAQWAIEEWRRER